MSWSKGSKGGALRGGLPSSFFGGAPAAPVRQGYMEALLTRGHRRCGRVMEDNGEELLVEFYDTGEREVVARGTVSTQWRET